MGLSVAAVGHAYPARLHHSAARTEAGAVAPVAAVVVRTRIAVVAPALRSRAVVAGAVPAVVVVGIGLQLTTPIVVLCEGQHLAAAERTLGGTSRDTVLTCGAGRGYVTVVDAVHRAAAGQCQQRQRQAADEPATSSGSDGTRAWSAACRRAGHALPAKAHAHTGGRLPAAERGAEGQGDAIAEGMRVAHRQ